MSSDLNRLLEPATVRVLLAIAEAGSFSRAAAALGVSQPSISQQVRRIEQHVGRRLFRRLRHGVELTPDGRAVVVYADAVQNLTRRLRERLERADGDLEVTVGMSEDFCRTALPSVLRLLMIGYPNVRVRVLSGTYDILTEALGSGAIEFVIGRRHDRFPETELLFRDRLVWFGADTLKLPLADPIPLVLPLPPSPSRDTVLDVLRRHGRRHVIRFESIGMAGMEMAIGSGLGVCAGPASMPLFTASPLPEASLLPTLPAVEFVLATSAPIASDAGLAFAALLREAARAHFALPEE